MEMVDSMKEIGWVILNMAKGTKSLGMNVYTRGSSSMGNLKE